VASTCSIIAKEFVIMDGARRRAAEIQRQSIVYATRPRSDRFHGLGVRHQGRKPHEQNYVEPQGY